MLAGIVPVVAAVVVVRSSGGVSVVQVSGWQRMMLPPSGVRVSRLGVEWGDGHFEALRLDFSLHGEAETHAKPMHRTTCSHSSKQSCNVTE